MTSMAAWGRLQRTTPDDIGREGQEAAFNIWAQMKKASGFIQKEEMISSFIHLLISNPSPDSTTVCIAEWTKNPGRWPHLGFRL